MDNHVYAQSLNKETSPDAPFKTRSFVYTTDTNNGSYPNGSISFDLATLSNSNKYIDFMNSFVTIPLVMTLNSAALTSNVENAFALSLKNGFHQLIDSIGVTITNNSVVNTTSFTNLDINYKILSQFSNDDAYLLKDTLGFSMDTPESIAFNAAATVNAPIGEYNNLIVPVLSTVANGWGPAYCTSNVGRLVRMKDTSFDPAAANPTAFTSAPICASVAKNYCASSASTTSIIYHIMATIPLRFLHPIFVALPLCKGIYCTLTINTNTQCSSTTTTTAASLYGNVTNTLQRTCIPYMISPNSTAGGVGLRMPAATLITAAIAIGKSLDGAATSAFMSNCRFYASMVEMEASHEEAYLMSMPSKKIKYNDILQFQTTAVGANGNISQVLTNQVARIRYLLGIPILDNSVNNNLNPMSSPFSSCPGTTAAYSHLSQFNILLSGSPVYPQNISYGYENYMSEIRGSGAINGGLTVGVNSGLLSKSDYESGYHYIYVDLSRKISDADDNVGRSIQVIGTNNANKTMQYIWIVGYQREIEINVATGNLIIP